jgi:hypothetical protein
MCFTYISMASASRSTVVHATATTTIPIGSMCGQTSTGGAQLRSCDTFHWPVHDFDATSLPSNRQSSNVAHADNLYVPCGSAHIETAQQPPTSQGNDPSSFPLFSWPDPSLLKIPSFVDKRWSSTNLFRVFDNAGSHLPSFDVEAAELGTFVR